VHPHPDGHHTQIHDHLHDPNGSNASIVEGVVPVHGRSTRVDGGQDAMAAQQLGRQTTKE